MLSGFEKIRLIKGAIVIIVYIIAFTFYFMFREMKQKAIAALTKLKLRLFNHVSDHQIDSIATGHIFIDGTSPSLSPIPNEIVTAAIKRSLPIIRYGDFESNFIEQDFNGSCMVCWENVERSDEIRDLVNCRHVFHRDCLDNWIDQGQITCPLCRSMLLPPFTNPWTIVLDQSNSSMEI